LILVTSTLWKCLSNKIFQWNSFIRFEIKQAVVSFNKWKCFYAGLAFLPMMELPRPLNPNIKENLEQLPLSFNLSTFKESSFIKLINHFLIKFIKNRVLYDYQKRLTSKVATTAKGLWLAQLASIMELDKI